MPLYEYQCTQCGKKTEVLQRFEDAPLAACPACGGAVKKLVSSPAFQFKGSGWYVTDYARKGGGEGKGEATSGAASTPEGGGASAGGKDGDKAAASKSDSKGESKSDSRSESKPDTASTSKSDSKTAAKTDSKPAAGSSDP